MKLNEAQNFTKKYSSFQVATHVALSFTRELCFLIMKADFLTVKDISPAFNQTRFTNNLIFGVQLTFFQMYIVLSAIILENHFQYILAVVFMIHNLLLMSALLLTVNVKATYLVLSLNITVIVFFITEILFALFCIFEARSSRGFDIFRKVGADPKLNSAYKFRNIVRSLGTIDVFLAVLVNGRFFLPPIDPNARIDFSVAAIFGLTAVQHLATNTQAKEENKTQRKIAISLSVFKVLFMIGEITAVSFDNYLSKDSSKPIKITLYADILLITAALTVFLYKDLQNFGLGLSKQLSFKTREIDLGK